MRGGNAKRGFTLIELMIVVVIIGLLAALAIPMYHSAAIKAKRSEAKIELKRIWEAMEEYKVDYGSFPDWWDGWVLYDASCPMYDDPQNCWNIPEDLPLSPMSGKPRFTYVIHLGDCPYDASFYTLGPLRYVLPTVAWASFAFGGGGEPPDDGWGTEEIYQSYWISAEPFDSWDRSLRDTDPIILNQDGQIFQVPKSEYSGGGGSFPPEPM